MQDPKDLETKTPAGNGQPEEKKPEPVDDTTKTEGEGKENVDEKVEISKSELEKLQKYKADFDGIIEKQRIEKLAKKENNPEAKDNPVDDERYQKLEAEILSIRNEKKQENLKNAYKEFSEKFPWANSEEKFSKISEKISLDGVVSQEDIYSRFKTTAIDLFPDEYSTHIEKQAKSKALADANKINIGEGQSGSSDNPSANGGSKKDPLEKLKERFAQTLPKGYKM